MLAVVVVAALAAASPVRISGIHFDGYLQGNPEPDSAIRLTNTDRMKPASVGGFLLTERFAPKKKKSASLTTTSADETAGLSARSRGKNNDDDEGLRLPVGTVIPPGGEVWLAATATGFRQVWGQSPDFEAAPTDPAVPDLDGGGAFLRLPGHRSILALVDDGGGVVDVVPYETTKDEVLIAEDLADLPWKGPPLRLYKTSFYGWTGQILARDRDERGALLKDTDSADDWDSGFSEKQLGEEPTHRVERAGQTRFVSKRIDGRAKVIATSSPDNNHQALLDAFAGAKRSLRVRIYEITNPKIVEGLIKAKRRGVDVTVYCEGAPVGGIADQERWLLDRAAKAGVRVYFIGGRPKQPIKPRYRFDHSKYVLVDDVRAIIGSENYGRSGVPAINSWGNRGWMVHIEQPEFVRQLRAVWDHDLVVDDKGEAIVGDIIDINESPTDAYGLPYRDPGFVPDETVHRGRYDNPASPVVVDGDVGLELVLSPDTSLNESSAVLGLIGRAQKTLYIEQNSIRRRWGAKADDKDTFGSVPNLALQAVIAAARRGVQTRVLLDSTWYNVQGDEDRDNDDTALFLNELAEKEGLDLVAKVINLETTALEKIHTKGIIVDDKEVFVGSINWTENSFKGNREVGVVVSHKDIAGYYARLFRRDWSRSRIFETTISDDKGVVYAEPSEKSAVLMRLGRGDAVFVVGEHVRAGKHWLEVRLPDEAKKQPKAKKDKKKPASMTLPPETAFVAAASTGRPLASPGEALHVIGKDAVVEGVVVATNVSDRRIQLRFADKQRPPFTAVIFSSNIERFKKGGLDPTSAFQGRLVRVTGAVKVYRGPEVIIEDPAQIAIVK